MSFVKRSIILCPYLGGSTIGGYTVCAFNDIITGITVVCHTIIYLHMYKCTPYHNRVEMFMHKHCFGLSNLRAICIMALNIPGTVVLTSEFASAGKSTSHACLQL